MTSQKIQRSRSCVLELTLACNARCIHCGSSAGERRDNELSHNAILHIFDQLARLGCESVTFSGGEPLLRREWQQLARAVRNNGMQVDIITNGLLVEELAEAIVEAHFSSINFSVDGPADVHDRLREVSGSLSRLLKGAQILAKYDIRLGAVTQVNKLNLDKLGDIHSILVENGFQGWQIQLTMPHGRAAERGVALCLAPEDLPELEAKLLDLYQVTPLFMQPADNIGYMSRNEPRLRAGTYAKSKVWTGCPAGLEVMGITSDGMVRGCLSMPAQFDEGSVRIRDLGEIWNDPFAFSYNRGADAAQLSEGCVGCAFCRVCRGGCKSLAIATTGDTRSNPYCLFQLGNRKQEGGV